MKCESLFCIYQHYDDCILPEQKRLDRRGICPYYCPIDIDSQLLQQEKRRLLIDYETPDFITEYDLKYNVHAAEI